MEIVAALLLGFVFGYIVREFISRRRGAKARRRHFELLAEARKRRLAPFEDLALTNGWS
jgi:hypothetical protein